MSKPADRMIPPDYVWFNGQVLTEREREGYNRRSEKINSQAGEHAERLRDERHLFLTICFETGGSK